MFSRIGRFILQPTPDTIEADRRIEATTIVGQKCAGLRILPPAWTPPYLAVGANLYTEFTSLSAREAELLLTRVAEDLFHVAASWVDTWPTGIMLRSSAVEETLAERGTNETHTLPADYTSGQIATAMAAIFEHFRRSQAPGAMAIVVQARVPVLALGHMSNERRVSKSVNQWMWELDGPSAVAGRFNSQRDSIPPTDRSLGLHSFHNDHLVRRLKQVGRWSTLLGIGRCHIEWGSSQTALWILQLDAEDDQPDHGCDPNWLFVTKPDSNDGGRVPAGSPFKVADLTEPTGWRKLDKVRDLISSPDESYPPLLWLTGDEFTRSEPERDLEADLRAFAAGRIVVRTDCRDPSISGLNLPRTDSVSPNAAIRFIRKTLTELKESGIGEDQIAFIIHRFIPAHAAAWVVAYPDRQVVLVDSLWGLPNGLQYLPHDTFEYDIRQKTISAEKLRYKPAFLQETSDGSWRTIRVRRDLARHRSLSSQDVRDIASRTHAISTRLGKPIQVMWFCRIPATEHVGNNIPWFSLPPEQHKAAGAPSATPGKRRISIRTFEDLEKAYGCEAQDATMVIEPSEPDLYRDNGFLDKIADVAQQKGYSVLLSGSSLSHAFYLLERRGISVIQPDGLKRARSRNRRVFKKLVRDDIPMKIVSQGENVTLAHLPPQEARLALVTKLFEEAHELIAASEREDVVGELSDIYELVRALCVVTGISLAEVEDAADEKRQKRGGFEKNIVLIQTSWPSSYSAARSSGNETVTLEDLVEIGHRGAEHTVTYPGLVGPRASTRIRLNDGQLVEVRLDGSGLVITERSEDDQPSLPL